MGAPIGNPSAQAEPQGLNEHLPRVWIGYLLSFATLVAMLIAVAQHPEVASWELFVPPLYLFLLGFVTLVYWLVCVYRLHQVLAHVAGWKHPVSPGRAVGFHFIPVYSLYWLYKWPSEVAKFVNWKLRQSVVPPAKPGLFVFLSYVACLVLGPGGLFLLFASLAYLNDWIKRALAAPPEDSPQDDSQSAA